jgi:hypothetical protein
MHGESCILQLYVNSQCMCQFLASRLGTVRDLPARCRWLAEKKAKAEAERQRRLKGRRDAKLPGVVISEKWDKKAQKYTTPNVPFPHKQKEVCTLVLHSCVLMMFQGFLNWKELLAVDRCPFGVPCLSV